MQERAAQSWENFYPRPPRGGRPLRVEASAASIPDFYPRPPRGGRRPSFSSPRIRKRFLSTPSARRATELRRQHRLPTPNFYPRPPRGGRRRNPAPQPREAHFYPRPPRGGRPQATPSASDRLISIHALREEGDPLPRLVAVSIKISIHALREEGDPLYPACGSRSSKISIHALREEGDTYRWSALKKPRYFYPRPPRGGRHILQSYPQKTALFLSTPSARRATQRHIGDVHAVVISIHALREEGDRGSLTAFLSLLIFLSTPSARRATYAELTGMLAEKFLSTPSARRATIIHRYSESEMVRYFYPRPPRGGRHTAYQRQESSHTNFYPRPPRGGRHCPSCSRCR